MPSKDPEKRKATDKARYERNKGMPKRRKGRLRDELPYPPPKLSRLDEIALRDPSIREGRSVK